MTEPLLQTDLPWPCRRGKVRDVYDLGDRLLIVSTDRISAFDWILPTGIPDKGRILTQISRFWFKHIDIEHHLLSTDLPVEVQSHAEISAQTKEQLAGRVMVTAKAQVIPFECVVRGYLEGSGWREYQADQTVCGIALPPGLRQCDRLAEPIFTPATKAESGHDENVSFETMSGELGQPTAERLRQESLFVYARGAEIAAKKGILIADTKFEWGWYDNRIILIDEVLTPDSSRFWPADSYQPGASQPSYDKQFVREWLLQSNWDRNSPPPTLPQDIVHSTREKYIEAFERLTDEKFAWR